jgi:hypothetical protein
VGVRSGAILRRLISRSFQTVHGGAGETSCCRESVPPEEVDVR